MTVVFDTLSVSKKLQRAGMTPDQAETQISALVDAFQNFPTKDDLHNAMNALRDELRIEMHEMGNRFEGRIGSLETKLEKLEMKLTIKLGAMLVVAVGLMAALVKLL